MSVLARNAVWMFAGQGTSALIQVGYFVLLARLLGTAQYGAYAAAAALVSVVSQYSTLGSGFVFMRYVSANNARFREYWGNVILSAIVASPILMFAVTISSKWIIHGSSTRLIILVAFADCLFAPLVTCSGQAFQAFERMKVTAVLNSSTNLLRLAAAALLLLGSSRVTATQWAAASLLASGISAVGGILIVSNRFGRPTLCLLTSHIVEGMTFAISCSTTSAYNDLDKIMLGHYGMNAANGIYAVAYRVINICTMPIIAIYTAAFPRFFQHGTVGAPSTFAFARKVQRKTFWVGLLMAAMMLLGAPFIPLLLGKEYHAVASALRWLCVLPLLRSFHWGAGNALAGAGFQHLRLLLQLIAAAFNFTVNLYLIPQYSWLGAAWASLLTDGVLAVLSWLVLIWLSTSYKGKAHTSLANAA